MSRLWAAALFLGILSLGAAGVHFLFPRSAASLPDDLSLPKVENFALHDQRGRLRELYRQTTVPFVALISYGIGCPIVEGTLPALKEIAARFGEDKVKIFFLDANPQDDRNKLAREAHEFQIPFSLLHDDTQEVARSLGFDRTGTVLLIDTKHWRVRYRGPVNDRMSYGVDKLKAKENYLEQALTRLLAGKAPEKNNISALGCAISIQPRQAVTYHGKIKEIIHRNCAVCHSRGQYPPGNLFTYEDLKGWGAMLREVLLTERMPPWEADPLVSKGKALLPLSATEKRAIYDWIASGSPEGPATAPVSESPPPAPITPDWEVSTSKEIVIPAGTDRVWHFEEVASSIAEDRYVSAYQFQFSNPAAIDHAILMVANGTLKEVGPMSEPPPGFEAVSFNLIRPRRILTAPVRFTDPRLVYKIPKGSRLYLQLHFRSTGKEERETVAVKFQNYRGKSTPIEIKYLRLPNKKFTVPAHTSDFVLESLHRVPDGISLLSLAPHMHRRGVFSRVTVVPEVGEPWILYSGRHLPEGGWANSFDPPIRLPHKISLKVEYEFDNSAANPNGIDPTVDVNEGQGALTEEMAVMHVYYFEDPKLQP